MSNTKPTIFISHSSKDGALATQVQETIDCVILEQNKFIAGLGDFKEATIEIEGEKYPADSFFPISCHIFVSSQPYAIEAGRRWQDELFARLDKADILIPIITPNSISSQWVWFEIGYFWSTYKGQNILPLKQDVEIPEPLNLIQGKSWADLDNRKAYFGSLEKIFMKSYKEKFLRHNEPVS